MVTSVEEICEKLKSNERQPKISVFKELQCMCESKETKISEIASIFNECYLYIFKCYSDRYESVREQAVETVTIFIRIMPPNDFHLLNIVTTLKERMGDSEIVEESEEIRLLYIQQLHGLMQHYVDTGNAQYLEQSYPYTIPVLAKALVDAYPAVQREACSCVVVIASSAETHTFRQCAEQLAKSLFGMLNHKHSLSRIDAVRAIGQVALHVDASGDSLSRILMEVSPLLMDSMPLVRRECGNMGVLLLQNLRDRYSYFDRIIPLVLCCLKDDSPEVVEYIRPLWMKCGKQYFEENEAELSKQELGDLQVDNYPEGIERPTIGCRGLVQRSLRLLNLITRESTDWKNNVRLHSIKLLYQFILHAECKVTAKFFEIFPEVARACCDVEPTVVNEAIKVADLMGRLFTYDDWCEHGFNGLMKNAKLGYLVCFYYMFTAAIITREEDILRVSNILIVPEFSQSLKSKFQIYIMKMLETMYEKLLKFDKNCEDTKEASDIEGGSSIEDLNQNMYTIIVKVMALSLNNDVAENLQEQGNMLLEKIAKRQCLSIDELHEKYLAGTLEYVDHLDTHLDSLSEPILLLHGILSICKFRASSLPLMQQKLNCVWENCADDAKVKIFSSISIAMLEWNDTILKEFDESVKLLEAFLNSVVEQHLQWRAGANAEAMRSLATATLCSVSQGAKREATQLLLSYAKYFTSLLEDHSVSTRLYAVKCLFNFGKIKMEELKPIAYALLQRLDDPSADIRLLAVSALPKLCPQFDSKSKDDKYEHDIWETFIRKAIDMMFLHYDGPEIRLKSAIKRTILAIGKEYPEICKSSYNRTVTASYNATSNLKELSLELTFLS